MNVAFTLGRIALVVIFVFSGVQKLTDLAATAAMIQSKMVIPASLGDVQAQIENAVGMSIWQVLAIIAAVIEIAGGLLIAFNVLTRTMAVVLLIFVAVTTFYFHDFWNMTGPDRANNLTQALKNLSIIGGLLILASWPRRVVIVDASGDRVEPL